ncbi:MAG: formate dehydrogenase accessory sulfurtransferase FdhD [Thermoanaerobaculia bacterium]|nr:MAG: formate dehydrogenase accessory sulfurtransferase FdhD [Thermoanaerobaculia bacterium]
MPARRVRGGCAEDGRDRLAGEAPLEIRFAGRPFTVLMRTPGHDEELVAGFLVTEGIIASAADLIALGHPERVLDADCRNVVEVTLAPGRAAAPESRAFYASASCGVCGKNSIADLAVRAPAVTSRLAVPSDLLETLPARLREAQPIFDATGGLHAAALFDAAGDLLAAREDIGRHNAVDKLVGWALGAGRLPASECVLIVSGRLGFEIVQKAIVAGIPVVGSVGAASSLAVALAESHRVTLAAFLRPGSMAVFGERSRIRPAGP